VENVPTTALLQSDPVVNVAAVHVSTSIWTTKIVDNVGMHVLSRNIAPVEHAISFKIYNLPSHNIHHITKTTYKGDKQKG